MPDYVNNSNTPGTSYQVTTKEYQVTRRTKRQGKENIKMKQKQTCAQVEGRIVREQSCCLLVVRSVLFCAQLIDNRRTTKKARRETSQEDGRDKNPKTNGRLLQGGGFSLKFFCLVFWGYPVRMINRDRS